MKRTYVIVAETFDKDGRRLSSDTHTVQAATPQHATEIAKGRQCSLPGVVPEAVRVEARIVIISGK